MTANARKQMLAATFDRITASAEGTGWSPASRDDLTWSQQFLS